MQLTFTPTQPSVFQNAHCCGINAQLFLLMLSLSVEKERKNKAQETLSRHVTARPDAFIHR